ncbi:hypothetical protein N431DRAFT_504755 [Stipitochalara longipes BDJ]|nr:hypothetical protein N431DRAFT_504755 [Stipitochalara longipes BDJ]
MATPNLYLAIRNTSPCHWYECYKQRDLYSIQKLYYSKEPIPGIYAITANRSHYLVAIRPVKGKKDTENIFKSAKNSYDDAILRTKADKANQITTSSLSKIFSFSSTQTTLIGDIDNKKDYTLGSSFTRLEHIKILQHDKPKHSKNYVLFGTGNAPHQKSPFRNHLVTKHDNRISPLLNLLGYHGESKLQEVDINGFKKLRQPLRIQFCSITQRWMFSSEIKTRTERVLVCKDSTCMKKSHEDCGKEIWRKMFALDDGYSWVEVGKLGNGKKSVLYRVDGETECMRRQSKEEMIVSMWHLERENGRFLECDESAGYMSLVRYIQEKSKDEKQVNKGEADEREIEKESAKRTKLESERVEEERLEKEWAKDTKITKNNSRTKLVNTWKVEIREARIERSEAGDVVEIQG